MQVRIETLPETQLVGKSISMSFAANRTVELWQSFMPQRKLIQHVVGNDFFSVEVYPNTAFFNAFNPNTEYQKWACVQVSAVDGLPPQMDTLTLSEGLYAVFNYKGLAKDAHHAYRYVFSEWLPQSLYVLDNRPHFARMGEQYKNNDPASEEELWFPIRKK